MRKKRWRLLGGIVGGCLMLEVQLNIENVLFCLPKNYLEIN